ncbi:hypothetical protein [Antarcticimicrobium sediminis]|uniref:Uncharacterized protein n=1 Tax=Antarcticimicrobium sediminis TaxID=2546227 RepID=A0A4R5EM20_9RHOB|nr:hypothetical protein [Antarcticimicrobium sediminis]TDE35440.1 hypothetical protein E1B25_17525 [Antarcticimicrobium sediminis]
MSSVTHIPLTHETVLRRHAQLISDSYFLGLEVGHGWLSLVERMLSDLEQLVEPGHEAIKVTDIKSKAGELHVSLEYYSDKIDEIIEKFEAEALKTCEFCGQPGRPRGPGWPITLCDEHAASEGRG